MRRHICIQREHILLIWGSSEGHRGSFLCHWRVIWILSEGHFRVMLGSCEGNLKLTWRSSGITFESWRSHFRIVGRSFWDRRGFILLTIFLDNRGAIRQNQMYDAPSPQAKMPSKINIFVLRQHKNSRDTDNVQTQFFHDMRDVTSTLTWATNRTSDSVIWPCSAKL